MKTNVNLEISRLIEYGIQTALIAPEDRAYAANRLLALLGAGDFSPVPEAQAPRCPAGPLERLCAWAVEQGRLEDNQDARDQFDTELMACLTPRPSEVAARFQALYQESPQAATDYYYGLSRATNYIRVDRVEKDRLWTAPTPYGDLVVTINLSKPEKDPKAIAAAKNAPKSGYPACALCRENEGYLGSANQAARGNHGLIPLRLCGEDWFLQYSPYVYYNEHSIVLSAEHRPMKVSRESFARLLEFVTLLPHYFLGSNADLPIVGGSILTHDHFQGGNYEFPMAKAGLREESCAYIVHNISSITGPINFVRPQHKKAKEEQVQLHQLVERTGISAIKLRQLALIMEQTEKSLFTAAELAEHLHISLRSASRLLAALEESGLAILSGQTATGTAGRPGNIYRIFIEQT